MNWRGVFAVFLMLLSAAVSAQEDKEASLQFNPHIDGQIQLWITLPEQPAWAENAEEVVSNALQVRLLDVFVYDEMGWEFYAVAENALPRRGFWIEGAIDVAPLFHRFSEEGYETCWLDITFPPSVSFEPPIAGAEMDVFEGAYYFAGSYDLGVPPQIAISFGYDSTDALTAFLTPQGIGLAFLLTCLLLVERARRGDAPADVRWFSFMRRHGRAVLALMVLYIFMTFYIDGFVMLDMLLSGVPSALRSGLLAVSVLGPIFLWQGLGAIVAAPLYRELRGLAIPRSEVVRLNLLMTGRFLIPLAFGWVGLAVLLDQETGSTTRLSTAVVAAATGIVVLLALNRAWMRAMGITPDALTSGELRDRVNVMGEDAGVRVREVFIIPAGPFQMANAFAMQGNSLMLTRYLLENMSVREVDAILAHELAHLRKGHPNRLMIVGFLVPFFGMFLLTSFSSSWLSGLGVLSVIAAGAVLFYLLQMATHRRFERTADQFALELTKDPEAMISAYAKLARLNMTPMQWSRRAEAGLTHPSMERRIAIIAENGGVSPERARVLVESGLEDSSRYAIPSEETARQKIFNTARKQRMLLRIVWGTMLVIAFTPVLYFRFAYTASQWGIPLLWLNLVGLSLIPLLVIAARNYMPAMGFSALRHELAQRAGETSGRIFAGLAPHREFRAYEGFAVWDVGFAGIEGDWLVYQGEETAFIINRNWITRIALQRLRGQWFSPSRIYIKWRNDDESGAFSIGANGYISNLRARKGTDAFAQELLNWAKQSNATPHGPKPPHNLEAPEIPDVSGQRLADINGCGAIALTVFVACIVFGVASVVAGLLRTPETFGQFCLAFLVTLVTYMLVLLPPRLLGSRPPREQTLFEKP